MDTTQNLVKMSDRLSLNNGTTGVDLKVGQANVIKAKAGDHYRIILQKEGVSKLLDNVIVKREGADLQLKYADGTQLTLSNYYNEAKGDNGCDIALPGQDGIDYIIGENNALGTELGDGTTLMYAHGDHAILMSMALGDTALQNTLADVSGKELSYIPGPPIMGLIAGINPWWVATGLAAIGGGVGAGVGLSGGSTSGENTGSISGENSGSISGENTSTNALNAIQDAAINNTAATSGLSVATYVTAGVTGVTSSNLAAINSVLDSVLVDGSKISTTALIQAIVNDYNAILASADGVAGNTTPALTSAQYTSIGVTNAPTGNALVLLGNVIDGLATTAVSTRPQVQALADAANAVMTGAAGGTAPTLAQLELLGIKGVTASNLVAVQQAIAATSDNGTGANTQSLLQGVATAGANAGSNAITAIQDAAINNTAATSGLSVAAYVTAGVTGVTSSNLAAINSVLDSVLVDGSKISTTALIQAIVNDYNAILVSADSLSGNTTPALTSAQYTSIGVTNAPTGNALVLLDNVIDGLATTAVSTRPQVQALADAANAVMTGAAGGTVPTLAQLELLGIKGVTASNLVAVQQAIAATSDNGTSVNTQFLLQGVATAGANAGSNAITAIQNAAINNTAATSGLSVATYVTAGVTGVTSSNLAAINSALDSVLVDGSKTSTTALIQAIVTGYNAILASADNTGGNTTTPITGEQYAAVGVTGVATGSPTPGTALALLDSVVDASPQTAVNLVGNLQKMADASAHVMAAGGSDADAANLSVADLQALGFTAVTSSNISIVRAAIKAVTSDGSIDSQSELAGIVNNAINNNISGPSPIFSPVFSTVLGGVTNLDVTSNLVLTSTRPLSVGSGYIRFTDLGGSNGGTGFHNDTTTNSFTIDVSTAVAGGLLSFDATHTKIIINPTFDLDLSSNYSISIDAGAFIDQSTGSVSYALAAVNFSTVTPGTHSVSGTLAGDARASQLMDDSGALQPSKSWIDLESYNTNNINGITQIGDLSTGAYALVMKNYATAPGRANSSIPDDGGSVGIQLHDVSIGVTNFTANDQLYFDGQANDPAIQKFAPEFLSAILNAGSGNFTGGILGQNLLNFDYDPNVTPSGSSNQIALGFQNSTQIFQFIYPYSGFTDMVTTLNITAPVVMG